MGIITWIIFGALAGWIASMLVKTDSEQGAFANIIVGILGAVAGGLLMGMVGGQGVTGFNLYSLMVVIGGAVILLLTYKTIVKRT